MILLAMYTRALTLPERSFFLFGPRGTGKTTWLRSTLADAHWVNLLLERELVGLVRDPSRFSQEVAALPAKPWVVVDEIQKLPRLLDEIQDLLTRFPNRYRFALTGSSVRKLKQEGVNLLPGRLINRRFYPLVAAEMGSDFELDSVLRFGSPLQ